MALSAQSSIGEWLDSPAGGPLAREMLAAFGVDEEKVRPFRGFAVQLVVSFSKGRVTQEMLDDIVRRANEAEDS